MKEEIRIAIASGKGGTGKTTLSVNLAAWLRVRAGRGVVLADLDVEEPNSGLFLGGTPAGTEVVFRKIPQWNKDTCILSGECASVCMYNAIAFTGSSVMVFPELCHGCYACSDLCPSGSLPMVDDRIGELTSWQVVLSGGDEFVRVEGRLDVGREMPTPMIKETIRYTLGVKKPGDIVLFDAPPGTSCPMMEAAKHAGFVLLVAEPTRFGRHDLSLAVETLRVLEKDFAVVINKDRPGETMIDDYCKKEKIPIAGRIPHLTEAARHYSKGELLFDKVPEVNKALEEITAFLERVFSKEESA
jgi:MinD superfamily P-loop ATPase